MDGQLEVLLERDAHVRPIASNAITHLRMTFCFSVRELSPALSALAFFNVFKFRSFVTSLLSLIAL